VTFSNIAVMLLAFVVLGGGAYAASGLGQVKVQGKSIARNAVTSPKVKNGSLKAHDFAEDQLLAGPRGPQGVPGDTGLTGPQGPKGEAGTVGEPGTARAFGAVDSESRLSRSKGIASVTNPEPGVFCVALANGIDSTATVGVVSPDFTTDGTGIGPNQGQAFAEWHSDNCADGALSVLTGVRSEVVSAGGFVQDVHNTIKNEGFSIVVP
jgi:hypothetical protein